MRLGNLSLPNLDMYQDFFFFFFGLEFSILLPQHLNFGGIMYICVSIYIYIYCVCKLRWSSDHPNINVELPLDLLITKFGNMSPVLPF